MNFYSYCQIGMIIFLGLYLLIDGFIGIVLKETTIGGKGEPTTRIEGKWAVLVSSTELIWGIGILTALYFRNIIFSDAHINKFIAVFITSIILSGGISYLAYDRGTIARTRWH